jgi:uncharacterized protein YegP (UPF0339 family)
MKYRIYQDVIGQWRWYLQTSGGRTLADSAEGYFNRQDCVDAIGAVKKSMEAPIEYAALSHTNGDLPDSAGKGLLS